VTPDRDRCPTCADEAVTVRVLEIRGREALVAVGHPRKLVAVDLVPNAHPGDLLLCHAGIALERIEGER